MTRSLATAAATALALLASGPALAQPALLDDSKAVANLQAFAMLYGLVRFFHPGDEAAAADWNAVATLGAARARDARTPADLRRALQSVFAPLAPSLALFPTGDAPPVAAPADTAGLDLVTWQHYGVGFGNPNNVYRSARTNRETPETARSGVFMTSLDLEPLRGHRVRLTASVRSEGAPGQAWLHVDTPGGPGPFNDLPDAAVRSAEWQTVTTEAQVPDDAVGVTVGGLVTGSGAASFDAFTVEAQQADGSWAPVAFDNAGFEAEGTDGWYAASPGYAYTVHADAAEERGALRVASAGDWMPGALFAEHVAAGEVAVRDLGRGLSAGVRLALWSRAGHTLPAAPPERLAALVTDLAQPADAQAVRLADVVVAWTVFEHFYPYFDLVGADWDAALAEALAGTLAAADDEAQCRALRQLIARLHDGHGFVGCPRLAPRATVPFAVEVVEGAVTVVATADSSLVLPGDVVVSLGGTAAADVLADAAALWSGSPQLVRVRGAMSFGTGPLGSTVRLVTERGGARRVADAVRDASSVPPLEARPEPFAELQPGVFYADLTRLNDDALDAQIETLAGARAVVFDLRGYPKVSTNVMLHLSDQPLRSAPFQVLRTIRPDRERPLAPDTTRWDLRPQAPQFTGRVAFITDARAISYSESLLGIVEAYRLGEIVGAPTAGANGNVNPFQLPSGTRVSWTGMRVDKHDGSPHHLVGIRPTVPAERTRAGVAAGRDEVLERAVAVVTE